MSTMIDRYKAHRYKDRCIDISMDRYKYRNRMLTDLVLTLEMLDMTVDLLDLELELEALGGDGVGGPEVEGGGEGG